MTPEELSELLESKRARLLACVRAEAKGLLRHESEDDLVQGIHAHALTVADRFEYRSDKELVAWLLTVARQHLVNRRRYWSAARRDGGTLLRVTNAGSQTQSRPGVVPAASATGPGTLAGRREQLALASKAVALLSSRDQELVRCMSEGVDLAEIARRLDLNPEAAKKARTRAVERFRQTFELLSKGRGTPREP